MNRPTFWMMCGLPGSGKSYQAKELAEQYGANIHSSDSIREELTGDINNQDINELVFKILHNRIKEDLQNGKNCIYDATNISYKKRMSFLQSLNKIPCEKICVLIATPYEQCLKNNDSRDRVVPRGVIERMYRTFDLPWYYEGWDEIRIEYSSESDNSFGWPSDWINSVKDYSQDNSHHTLTLGEHCWQVFEYLNQHQINSTSPEVLKYAAMLHDCGKPFCKTFMNTKGEVTEQAHYYSHEHTGSYDSLFYQTPYRNLRLRMAVLIRWHMQPYFWERDNNVKLQNKYRKLWGEDLYNDIMELHAADKAAH
jgi:predicted kinase